MQTKTVQDLIDQLVKFDPSMPLLIEDEEYGTAPNFELKVRSVGFVKDPDGREYIYDHYDVEKYSDSKSISILDCLIIEQSW